MGRWKDQDGYWVDEDYDDYADPKPPSNKCVCDPNHEMPGTCPGRRNCPYADDSEPEEPAP